LQKSIAKEFAGSKLDALIADALAGTPVSLPVRPEISPDDLPDELPTRRGREPKLPVRVDPVTDALRADLRTQLDAITKEIAAQVEVTPDTDELRTELSAAITAIEASLTADIPTEPGGRREYERQLREQVDEVSRTVRARINADVDVDADNPRLRGDVDVAGQTVGRSLATGIMSALTSGMSAVSGPVVFGGLLAAAAATAPLLGASLAGGILVALGGGVIGLGLLGVKDDPRFKAAATDLGATLKSTLAKAAAPLLGEPGKPGPLLRAMETLKQLVIDVGPSLEQMFAAIGPYLPGLAEGIAAFVREALPGMVEAVKAAGPLLEVIALNLGPLGESVGTFLSVMAKLAPAAADAFNVIFWVVNRVVTAAAGFIYVIGSAFSGLFGNVKDAREQIEAAWAAITRAFSAGVGAARRFVEGFVAAALRLWRSLTDRLTGGTRTAINTVTGFFGGLPGRVRSAVGNLGNLLFGSGKAIVQGLINGVRAMLGSLRSTFSSITNSIPDWKGPMDRDRRLLEPSGAAIMGGLIRGIGGEVPALRSQLGSVTDLIAGAPLAATAAPYGLAAAAPAPAVPMLAFGGDAPDSFMRWMRENVRIYYGGSAQAAVGS
jgi:hypothetical protein